MPLNYVRNESNKKNHNFLFPIINFKSKNGIISMDKLIIMSNLIADVFSAHVIIHVQENTIIFLLGIALCSFTVVHCTEDPIKR